MRRLLRAPAAAFLIASLAGGALARAERASPLRLTLEGCSRDDEARLRELIAIEIGTFSAEAPPRETVVRVACGEDRAVITLQDDEAGRPSSSVLRLGGASDATRLRLLALSITELVALSWGEPRTPAAPPAAAAPAAAPPPAAPPAVPVVTESPRSTSLPRWHLFAAPSVRRIGAPTTWLAGVGLGGELAVARWLGLALGLGVEGGETATPVAAIGWRALTVMAGVAFHVQDDTGRWSGSALPGLALGLVRLSASPGAPDARGESLDGVWMGPMLAGRLRRAVGRSAFVQLELGGGVVTRRIAGLVDGDAPLVQVRGLWSSASVGAGLTL